MSGNEAAKNAAAARKAARQARRTNGRGSRRIGTIRKRMGKDQNQTKDPRAK